jgi:hypothetical protein
MFPSKVNVGSDFGYIAYVDNVAQGNTFSSRSFNYFSENIYEASALIIGCENDGPGALDSVIITPAGHIVLDPSGGVTYITGNVGIGTTTPAHALDISGNGRITGNVGIGISPTAKLHTLLNCASTVGEYWNNNWAVFGSLGGATSAGIGIGYSSTANSGRGCSYISSLSPYGADGWKKLQFDANSFVFNCNHPNAAAIGVGVGINTSSPAYTLDVSGNLNANTINENGTALSTKYAVINGTPTFTTVTAQSFNATSDYRIKEIIEPLNANYTIDNLTPIHYKNKLTDKEDIGFLAHDVQEFYPFLVSGNKDEMNENGEPKYQSINYNGLIGLLVNEIQILKKEIKEIKEKTGL